MTAATDCSSSSATPEPTTLRLLLSIVHGFFRSLLNALIHACLRISTPPTTRFVDSPAFGIFGQLNDSGTATRQSISHRGSLASQPNISEIPSIVHDDDQGGDGWNQVVGQRRISKMFADQYTTGMVNQTTEARRPSLAVPNLSPTSTQASSQSSIMVSKERGLRVREEGGREGGASSLLVPSTAEAVATATQSRIRKRAMSEGTRSAGLLVPNTPTMPCEHVSDSDSARCTSEEFARLEQYSMRSKQANSEDLGLHGYSMGIFAPANQVRVYLARMFSHRLTSCLMTTLLLAYFCTCASEDLDTPEPRGLFKAWPEAIRTFLFVVFTIEALARIVVTGFLFDQRFTPTDLYINIMSKTPVIKWFWIPKNTSEKNESCKKRRRRRKHRLSQRGDRSSAPIVLQKPPKLQVPERTNRIASASGDRQRSVGDMATTQGSSLSPSVIPSSTSRSSYTVSTISGIIHDISVQPTRNTRIRPGSSRPSTPHGSPELSDEEPAINGHQRRRRHRSRSASASASDRSASPYDGYSSGGTHPSRRQSVASNESLYSYWHGMSRDIPTGSPMADVYTAGPMRPFLRHTFNRLDLLSTVSFWIGAIIAATGKHNQVIMLFNSVAAIRFVRLMSLTPGSYAVIGSLKRSSPMLGKVSLYMGFFFLVFASMGGILFRGAYSRRCISATTLETAIPERFCCSYMENGRRMPYLIGSGAPTVSQAPRAYACPQDQICMTVGNPENSLMNFDNIFASAIQVFIIASAQGWTDIMYVVMDSISYGASVYFVSCVMIIQLWLINLFVAVINETFAKIREETDRLRIIQGPKPVSGIKRLLQPMLEQCELGKKPVPAWRRQTAGEVKRAGGWRNRVWAQWILLRTALHSWMVPVVKWTGYQGMQDFWCLLVIVDVYFKVYWHVNISQRTIENYLKVSQVVSAMFGVEVVVRMARAWVICPKPRTGINYWYNMLMLDSRPVLNIIDLVIVVADIIMEFGYFSDSQSHRIMYVFSSLRTYRLIENFPKTRALMHKIKDSVPGLLRILLTIGLTICLGAAVSMQLIGGYVPAEDEDGNFIQMRYNTYPHALLSTYQLFSGADWTDLLWEATGYMQEKHENWLVAIYMCAFYYFTNYILLNMLIALIMDNFEISEKEKRIRQLAEFHNSLTRSTARFKPSIVSRWNPYLYVKPNPAYANAHDISKSLAKSASRQKDKDSDEGTNDAVSPPIINKGKGAGRESNDMGVSSEIMIDISSSSSELRSRGGRRSSAGQSGTGILRSPRISISQSGNRLEVGGMQGVLFGKSSAEQRIVAQEVSDMPNSPISPDPRSADKGTGTSSGREAAEQWEKARRDFESAHPTYNRSMFLFSPDNMLRQICCMLDTGYRFSEDAFGDHTPLAEATKFSSTFMSNMESVDTTATPFSLVDRKGDADEKGDAHDPVCYPPPIKRSHRATTEPKMLWQQKQDAHGRPGGFGATPKYWLWAHYAWETLGFAVTIISIVVLCIDTPVRRKHMMDSDQMRRFSWFYFTTMALGIFCSIEVMVKGVAHGFVLAPHASLKTPWNIIDLLVSVSLFVSLYTLVGGSNATRFVRFLRSLRSVRLISKFKDARDAFNNLLVSSAANIIVGMWIMLLLLIPCATLANNMWYSLLFTCNDDTVDSRIGCIGEYFDSDLGILIPRVWANPHNYDFDTFINAFAILFTAISNEGWTDVMSDTMAIRGIDLQPSPNYAWWNSLWWVAYSMFATIFVLYIFIGIIVASYTQRTGTAFLTTEQRRWLDLKVQLRGTHSPTLPRTLQKKGFRRWCFMASIKTNTWYSRTLTIAALANCIVLLTVYRDRSTELDRTQKGVRYAAYIVFVLDFVVHIVGMGVRATLRNANYQLLILCALVIVLFEFIFTTLGATSFGSVMLLYKLTLISDSLNELTRMVIGGFRPILSLFWVWMVVTLIFTLLTVELWGLTRAGPETSAHANFWSFLPAFLTLLRFSYGENWNYLITDLQVEYPNCVASYNGNYLETDCGQVALPYVVFVLYNLLSMYIFVNVFIGVVTDNFQYCYQSSSSYKLLSRQEIRQFRVTWWRFDPEGTGYIPREKYAAFFSKLKPPFNVGMYGDRLKLKHLVKALNRPSHGKNKSVHVEIDRIRYTHSNVGAYTHPIPDNEPLQYDLNISELERCLRHADPYQMRLNRREFNRIYQEALLIDNPKRGMGFTQMLIFLARKKMVDPATAFLVEETLRYNDLAEQVDEVLRQKFVEDLIVSTVHRRKFLTAMKLHRRLQGLQSRQPSLKASVLAPLPIVQKAEDVPPIPLVRVHQPELRIDTSGTRHSARSDREPLSPPVVSISPSPDPVPDRQGTKCIISRSKSTTLEPLPIKSASSSPACHPSSLPSIMNSWSSPGVGPVAGSPDLLPLPTLNDYQLGSPSQAQESLCPQHGDGDTRSQTRTRKWSLPQ